MTKIKALLCPEVGQFMGSTLSKNNICFAIAVESTVINATATSPLFDGNFGSDEWKTTTKIKLPAQAGIDLMYDKDSLYVCAKGKGQDYVVIHLYIEHVESGVLHNLHASVQLGERLLVGKQ